MGAPRTGEVDREGGQAASRCASAGISAGLEYRPPWGSSLCGEPSGQGPRARGRNSKEKVFYEKERKRPRQMQTILAQAACRPCSRCGDLC